MYNDLLQSSIFTQRLSSIFQVNKTKLEGTETVNGS